MALQTSGAISLNDIHVEAGGSSGTLASINDSDIRGLIGKGSGAQMSFGEWYGASSSVFDTATIYPSLGRVWNGYGTAQTGSGTVRGNYDMTATSGSQGVSCAVCSVTPLAPNTTYTLDYDVTMTGNSQGTNLFLCDNSYASTAGLSNSMQVSSGGINTKKHLISFGYWQTGGVHADTGSGFAFWNGNSNATHRIVGTGVTFTTDQYGYSGVGIYLSQSRNANNNPEYGAVTVNSFVIT